MPSRVSLTQLIDELDWTVETEMVYIDPKRGDVIRLTEDDLAVLDGTESFDVPSWQLESLETVRAAYASDRLIEVDIDPRNDIDEFTLMREFAEGLPATTMSADVLSALGGPGTFRRFKDACLRHDLLGAWDERRRRAIADCVTDWLVDLSIPFDDDL